MMNRGNSFPQLPRRWIHARLGEVAEMINPGFPSGKHNKNGIGAPHLRPMNINIKGEIDLTDLKYVESKDHDYLLKGDVLFNNTNSPELLGKTAWIRQDTNWAYSNHMTRIRLNLNLLNPAWISYCLHNLFFSGFFRAHCVHHVNQASIGSSFLAEKVVIPLPPLPEQHRIVAKIEELFTRLDAGVEALKKVKAQLKAYHQAVLRDAFEGKLTAQWREAHKGETEPASVLLERIKEEGRKNVQGKVKELPPLDTSDLPRLPEGWVWTRLGEVTELVLGQSPPSSTYNENGNGLPFYQGKLEFGSIYPTPRKWCTAPKKVAEKGDVLISVRAPVGPTNICPDTSCIGRGLAAIHGLAGLDTLFILYLMRAFEYELLGKGTGTTFDAITGDMLRNFVVPLPPLPEQPHIIEEIERRFSVADQIEKTVEQSLKQAERLRKSILKKAFEGKLVPQDPTDEPADKLLERIKAERAKKCLHYK